jgi:serine phosphatase RsbU (regulator of sigma subunit)
MFNRWRITQKQKLIIEKQKEKIVDSITYAQLIQQSILMEESEIQKLLPDSFIYFQPKDIVSGDFYWCSVINNKIIIAAVDCTGHGVPGAFMSMIGNTLLNQIVNEKQITKPSEILRLLNQEVIESLHQTKDGALSKDGMAISLCSIDFKNNQLEYAGAENPLYLLVDKEITVINADKHGIGSGGLMAKKNNPLTTDYTNHIIPIKKDMSVFLFSDGYMDQFGGSERKKFGIQKFKELLLNNQQLSMQQQKEVIAKAQKDWKGNTAQVDDILVMGVKL